MVTYFLLAALRVYRLVSYSDLTKTLKLKYQDRKMKYARKEKERVLSNNMLEIFENKGTFSVEL